MKILNRLDRYPGNGPDELSVLSWNLLAPSLFRPGDGGRQWRDARLPLFRRAVARFLACDVICFQEVDTHQSLDDISAALAPHGFASVVQDRGKFDIVNATFFKSARLRATWAEHRSRTLLSGLLLPDGRELAVINVHLQAGGDAGSEATRQTQLESALRRAASHSPWCVAVCGDFNSRVAPGTPLRGQLAGAGLSLVPGPGPTYIPARGAVDTLDHLCAGEALAVRAALGSEPEDLRAACRSGLPNADFPSDHLPVGAVFRIRPRRSRRVPPVVAPAAVSEAVRSEWLAILSTADARAGRQARKSQRRLEASFLGVLGEGEAESLRRWRADAEGAARVVVSEVLLAALERVRAERASSAAECRVFDPGGRGGEWIRPELLGG